MEVSVVSVYSVNINIFHMVLYAQRLVDANSDVASDVSHIAAVVALVEFLLGEKKNKNKNNINNHKNISVKYCIAMQWKLQLLFMFVYSSSLFV